jgi:hypothetical protein
MTERVYWSNPVIDRTGWESGPWDNEPDKVQWIDEATDLDCLAVRNHYGSWCGYVGLPPGHRWHGRHYHEVEDFVDVHGGLTFSDSCMEDMPEDRGVCHVPEPDRPADVWWLGFDCGHFMDLSPGMEALLRELRSKHPDLQREHERLRKMAGDSPVWHDTYCTLDYVRAEVARLAEQLA